MSGNWDSVVELKRTHVLNASWWICQCYTWKHICIYIYMNVNANTTKMRFQRMRSMHICIYIKSLLVEATQICQAVPQPVGFRSAEFVWFVSQELPKIPGFHIILFPAFWACSKQTNRHHYKNLTICF